METSHLSPVVPDFKSRWGHTPKELDHVSIYQVIGEWLANLSSNETGILVTIGHWIIELG